MDREPGDSRLRVLRIITRLNVGGPTRHVGILARHLGPGFDQFLVHGPCPAGEGGGILGTPVRTALIPDMVRRPAPLADRRAMKSLRERIREFQPHIVHTHQGKGGALGRLAAQREGVPVVVHTYHGHTFEGYFGPIAGSLVRWFERRAAAASSLLICQSPSQRLDVERAFGSLVRDRIAVVPPAVEFSGTFDRRSAREDVRRELGASGERPVILVPARLAPVKRPLFALETVRELARRLGPLCVWFLGDGPLRPALERQAGRLGGSGVDARILGFKEDPRPFYAGADLTLLASRMEGTPLALIESLISGTPVAAPAVGGIPDIVGTRGLLLPPDRGPAEWAADLHRGVFPEGPPGSVPPEVREEFARRHDPAAMGARVASLYRDLAGAR